MRVRTTALGLLLLALAGCGTSADADRPASDDGDRPTSEKQNEQQAVLEYARCMRENGVPDFPDPEWSANGEAKMATPEGVDKETLDAAHTECKRLMPNGGEPREMDPELTAKLRAFSKCMRENGVPGFPDPRPGGGIAVEAGPDLDPNSAEYKAAEEKCNKILPDGGRGGSTDQENGE
jgi:hypothetical protein